MSVAIEQPVSCYKFIKIDERLPVITEVYEDDLSISINRTTPSPRDVYWKDTNVFDYNILNNSNALLSNNFLKEESSGYISRNSNYGIF